MDQEKKKCAALAREYVGKTMTINHDSMPDVISILLEDANRLYEMASEEIEELDVQEHDVLDVQYSPVSEIVAFGDAFIAGYAYSYSLRGVVSNSAENLKALKGYSLLESQSFRIWLLEDAHRYPNLLRYYVALDHLRHVLIDLFREYT